MNQFSRIELMTLEIVKSMLINSNITGTYSDDDILINRAENIAIALYNRFEENNSGDE